MEKPTRTRTVYRSRSVALHTERALTRRRFSVLGTAVVVSAPLALAALLVGPDVLAFLGVVFG